MPDIGLVTTDPAGLRVPEPDTAQLADGLRRDGHRADLLVWHDETVAWADYDLLIIRTPWD